MTDDTQERPLTDIVHDTLPHAHVFHTENILAERSTRRVVALTAVMMIVEILGGWWFNSMALLGDGLHMSSHAVALGLSAFAYAAARHLSRDPRFSFGTWKIEVLGGYTSALLLLGVAGLMVYESIARIAHPVPIQFDQAIPIAVVGLVVNLVSAWMLKDAHGDHAHHGHHHHEHHHDLNLRSAYIHVIADAATSVLAIVALLSGKLFGLAWMDPVMGIVGAIVIAVWSYSLIRDTGKVLLDADMDNPVVEEIREVIRNAPFRAELYDLHVWRVGKGKFACIVGIAADGSVEASEVRKALQVHEELVHITVETAVRNRSRVFGNT